MKRYIALVGAFGYPAMIDIKFLHTDANNENLYWFEWPNGRWMWLEWSDFQELED